MSDTDEDVNIDDLPEDDEEKAQDEPKEGETEKAEGETDGEAVEEEEKLGEEEEEHVEEEEIPEVFVSEDFISEAFLSNDCTLPSDIIEFQHSFGYDCKRYFNLCVADDHTLIFASGNLLHVFDVPSQRLWFRRSAGGGGIGHIAKNPKLPHVAVGEKGVNPLIIIYEWPSLEIVCVLRDGTMRAYAYLDYSPNGEMLCSQGGDPDYMLTIWNWRKSRITLRRKAYGQAVVNAMFSPFVPGQLSSCGTGHIKFWKMAQTFTGLKLIGELGRFGKTEMSDIIGILPLPDEKVISGSQWGNMLLWEEGLIKVEVFRKNRQHCHTAPITQLRFENGELTTVGMDGVVRVWYFDTIDQADPPDDDRVIEIEPLYEYEVGPRQRSAQLMCMLQRLPDDPDEEPDGTWFTQDANGGLWSVLINGQTGESRYRRMMFSHAGAVADMAASPCGEYVATLGLDGRMYFYNYVKKELLVYRQFPAGGLCMIWLPLFVDRTGTVIIAGFHDGVLRVMVASLIERERFGSLDSQEFVTLIQVTKPHNRPITALSLNPDGKLIVTGGEDSTVFIHVVLPRHDYIGLVPVGFVRVPSPVTFLNWKPGEPDVVMICCRGGELVEMTVPERIRSQTAVSYELLQIPTRSIKFQSVKSQIRRDIKVAEIEDRKNKKIERKKEELAKIKAENPGLDFDEDTFLEDSEDEEELEPLHFPEVPNRILFAMYTESDTIWLSMAGYDAGYIYEYDFKHDAPVRCTMVHEADDIEIHSFVYYHNRKYLLLGMQDGKIRVNRVNPEDCRDLKDYWLLPMHDNNNGVITRMCFSFDQRYLFTCGQDGNIFSYSVHPENGDFRRVSITPGPSLGVPREAVDDIEDITVFSLEEMKIKIDYDRRMAIANERKGNVLKILSSLAEGYMKILTKNKSLPASQVFPAATFEIDPRVTEHIQGLLDAEMNLAKRKISFMLEKSKLGLEKVKEYFLDVLDSITIRILGIDIPVGVEIFRQRRLDEKFYAAIDEVKVRIEEAEARGRMQQRKISKTPSLIIDRPVAQVESFLKGLNTTTKEFKQNLKLRKLLAKYLARKRKRERREDEWLVRRHNRPDPNRNHPDDEARLEHARQTIGDFKLKSAEDYCVPKHLRMTTIKKYLELLESRERLFHLKNDFNLQVFALRKRKLELIEHCLEHERVLWNIKREVGETRAITAHPVPDMVEKVEMPERAFQLKEEDVDREMPGWKMVKVKSSTRSMHMADVVMRWRTLPVQGELDEEYEAIMLEGYRHEDLRPGEDEEDDTSMALRELSSFKFNAMSQVSIEELEALAELDSEDTPWEEELKKKHLTETLYRQETTNRDADERIRAFDDEVKRLEKLRLQVEVDAKFLDLFVLKLNQELIVLKAFESREEFLSTRVMERQNEDHDMKSLMNGMNREIDAKNREINKLGEKEKEISVAFNEAVVDNKFEKHLRKIYKKKYKPPKVQRDDSDEDSSSSSEDESSDDEDDGASLDSREVGPIRMDETVCPDGCDKELFQLTFTLRGQRHLLENEGNDIRKQIEAIKKDLEAATKKKRLVEAALHTSQEVLEAFQREKQQKLNQVDVVVTMRMDQMHHFLERYKLARLTDTLVFSERAMKALLCRTAELTRETAAERERLKKSHTHMHEVKIDCKIMEGENADIRKEIVECKIRKFGGVVDVEFLEEALLRKLIAGLRAGMADYRREQDKRVAELRNELSTKKDHLCCTIKDNTEKLNILIVLEKDQARLTMMLRHQDEHLARPGLSESPYKQDVKDLRDLLAQQLLQLHNLKKMIKKLRSKTIPKPVVPIVGDPTCSIPEHDQDRVFSARSGRVITPVESTASEGSVFDPGEMVRTILNELVESLRERELVPSGSMDDVKEGVRQLVNEIVDRIIDGLSEKDVEREIQDDRLTPEEAREIINQVIDSIPSRTSVTPYGQETEATVTVKEILNEILQGLALDPEANIPREILEEILASIGIADDEPVNQTMEGGTS